MVIDERPTQIVIDDDGRIFIEVDERPFWRRWLSAAMFWSKK